MTSPIAIVGMSCVYPDARSPMELWENVLAQRRAFRRMPAERMNVADYLSADPKTPDCTYIAEAAVVEGYEFDRVAFRVVGSTYRSADLAHWLALDVAARALADAGFQNGEGLSRDTTGVVVGNTLTGEFSRANVLRLRWPYVQRVVDAALAEQGWSAEKRQAFFDDLAIQYKAPFPPVGEETLAGGLSNTIAGRICNQFNLKGGGYTIDGACASSLLAVANACSSLAAGDLDVALTGGVDLSLDPFEIVGFSKTGALAPEEMRIYDARSAGFWPGEGCGMVVLMRYDEAVTQNRRIYAVIRGWGISSDGSGGITRPEMDGQLQAVRRAYRRAGFGADTVSYFEGHGTGTNVGDATELRVLSQARREVEQASRLFPPGISPANIPPAVIGSIKANIGHTKAAAGIAGLIKATMAVHTQLIPPTTGCQSPHAELSGDAPALRIARDGECWPADRPLRAGISAMGFGGINTHVVIEGQPSDRRGAFTERERSLLSSYQDAELFLLGRDSVSSLATQVDQLLGLAEKLSRAELADLAADLQKALSHIEIRAAIVAATPAELAERLAILKASLAEGIPTQLDFKNGVFAGTGNGVPRLGFLFPGQGSPTQVDGGMLRRRFGSVRELYDQAQLPEGDSIATQVAQPALCASSLAGLRVLRELGLNAHVAVGHSLGEITALHWAGAFDAAALLRIARVRGKAMAELGSPTGGMAAIAAPANEVASLLQDADVSIVGFNSPRQTVVAGDSETLAIVMKRAQSRGLRAVKLAVSHGFHTPLVAAAAPVLEHQLSQERMEIPLRTVVSTVTGVPLTPEDDLRLLLCKQVTSPVKFIEAVTIAAREVDLFIEVGPGHVLSGLAADCIATPTVALDCGGASLRGLLQAAGAAFALGARLNHTALFRNRFTRPFSLDWKPKFFANPCEQAPVSERRSPTRRDAEHTDRAGSETGAPSVIRLEPVRQSPLDLVRQLVADRAELPVAAVSPESRMLGDLHLNSITVGQLVAEAARRLQLPPLIGLTDFATATVLQIAEALEALIRSGVKAGSKEQVPAGVDTWVRPFVINWVQRELRMLPGSATGKLGGWQVFAHPDNFLASQLRERLARCAGPGVLVCMPVTADGTELRLLLEGARAALKQPHGRFVLVQPERNDNGAASFARSLHLEHPHLPTCAVELPFEHPSAVDWIAQEARAAQGHVDARYDENGARFEPVLAPVSLPETINEWPLGEEDVLLVTGGGKGIAFECALSLARKTGVKLALLGRSEPASDPELEANLERLRALEIPFRYFSADVTDATAVRAGVAQAEKELGPVTALLHAAGVNVPQTISSLDEAAFRRTLAPKISGARNVLAAINPETLRLFVSFGSVIGRAGLQGEADYAVANERLTQLTQSWQAAHPHCRCLALEWSVWSGVGMGARLGRIESLRQQGITPISPEAGVEILESLLRHTLPAVAIVVTGRFGELPTLKLAKPELPFLRFLEQPRAFYPGVELVADSFLSSGSDPYLDEHVYHGERLFPAVMGLEAMAQAAMALVGSEDPPGFENIELTRPVVAPREGKLTIRLAALARQPGVVEVVLRTDETGFQADHFRATCRFEKGSDLLRNSRPALKSEISNFKSMRAALEPAQDLYEDLLFHTGRFQRVLNYRLLNAKECVVQLEPDTKSAWFSRYLPQDRVLGDSGVRDAAIHAIQACIPHARLLPVGVRRVVIGKVPCLLERLRAMPANAPIPELLLHAREVAHDGDLFDYDLDLLGEDGTVLEHWEGLRLRKVESIPRCRPWPGALVGPHIERRLEELFPRANIRVAFARGANSEEMAKRLTGEVEIHHRADGKPELTGSAISIAHAGELTLAVAGVAPVACDLEPVTVRSLETWRELLGIERFRLAELIAEHEEFALAATRVWAATECLKKAGAMTGAPCVMASRFEDSWAVLRSGPRVIATGVMRVSGTERNVVTGVLSSG